MKHIILSAIVMFSIHILVAQNNTAYNLPSEKAIEISSFNDFETSKYSCLNISYPSFISYNSLGKKIDAGIDMDVYINNELLGSIQPDEVIRYFNIELGKCKIGICPSGVDSISRTGILNQSSRNIIVQEGYDAFIQIKYGNTLDKMVQTISEEIWKKMPLQNSIKKTITYKNISPQVSFTKSQFSSLKIIYPEDLDLIQMEFELFLNDTSLGIINSNNIIIINGYFNEKTNLSICHSAIPHSKKSEILKTTNKLIHIKPGNNYLFEVSNYASTNELLQEVSLYKWKKYSKDIPQNNVQEINNFTVLKNVTPLVPVSLYVQGIVNENTFSAEIYLNNKKISYLTRNSSITFYSELDKTIDIKAVWGGLNLVTKQKIHISQPQDYHITLEPLIKKGINIVAKERNQEKIQSTINSFNRYLIIGRNTIQNYIITDAQSIKTQADTTSTQLALKSNENSDFETYSKIETKEENSFNNNAKTTIQASVILQESIKIDSSMKFALIIGNEDYKSKNIELSEEVNVKYAINDANLFRNYANSIIGIPNENIIFLENATAIEMHRAIKKISLLSKACEGDANIFFYYAGHGIPHEQTKESFLIPVDIGASDLEFAISLNKLYNRLTEYPSSRVTVILDACFSGGGREGGLLAARGVRIIPKENPLKGNLVVFAASSKEQSALPFEEKKHGMFTYFFMKKLEDTNGNCSYEELSLYLKQRVGIKSILINDKEQSPKINVSQSIVDEWKKWKWND